MDPGSSLTQVAFAEQLAVHANTLARYERDEISIPAPVAQLSRSCSSW
jgi:hypothetical protein